MALYVVILFLAFAGLLIATYLRHKKKRKESFVCPLRAKCDVVLESKYSKFFGVPVELAGVLYYGTLALGYGVVIAGVSHGFLATVLLILTSFGFLFSVYLTFIQIFSIRHYCTWCLFSAAISTTIFALSLSGAMSDVQAFLIDYRAIIVPLHAMSAAVGLGAATIADVLFFRFLKDFRISENESSTLEIVSQVIWAALAIIIITGFGLFLTDPEGYMASSKFIVKMTIVGIITLNGAFLNLLVAPKLVNISFGKEHAHRPGELHRLRRLAFTFGPISILSWYVAFLLGSLRSIPVTVPTGLALYAGIILIGIAAGQAIELFFSKRAIKT